MLHWPVPSDFAATVQSRKAAEKLLAEGRTRAIGVANFTPTYLKNLLDRCDVTPAVDQVEIHPPFTQKDAWVCYPVPATSAAPPKSTSS